MKAVTLYAYKSFQHCVATVWFPRRCVEEDGKVWAEIEWQALILSLMILGAILAFKSIDLVPKRKTQKTPSHNNSNCYGSRGVDVRRSERNYERTHDLKGNPARSKFHTGFGGKTPAGLNLFVVCLLCVGFMAPVVNSGGCKEFNELQVGMTKAFNDETWCKRRIAEHTCKSTRYGLNTSLKQSVETKKRCIIGGATAVAATGGLLYYFSGPATAAWTAVKGVMYNIAEAAMSYIASIKDIIVTTVAGLYDKVIKMFKAVNNAVKKTAKYIGNKIVESSMFMWDMVTKAGVTITGYEYGLWLVKSLPDMFRYIPKFLKRWCDKLIASPSSDWKRAMYAAGITAACDVFAYAQ